MKAGSLLIRPIRRSAVTHRSAYSLVQRNADQARPLFEQDWLSLWENASRQISPTELALRLERDGLRAETVPWDDIREQLTMIYVTHLGSLAKKTAIDSMPATLAAQFADPVETSLEFQLRLLRSEEYLSSPEFQRILTTLTSQEIAAVRQLMETSFRLGVTPYDTAAQIKRAIGLTPEYLDAIARYSRNLTVSDARREVLTERYRNKLLRYRAETITRTETIRAANIGQLRLWQTAFSQGLLPAGRTRRLWIITPDDKLCDRCQLLRGKTATLTGVYRVGSLYVTTPPAHPRCRCAMGLVFD
jgi:hypothetical protein